jgi:hypothetical protein
MNGARLWSGIDRLLARLRTRREAVSLALDAVVIALAWNFTYLFRLGFERWWSARPDYDPLVMAGVIAAYLVVFGLMASRAGCGASWACASCAGWAWPALPPARSAPWWC